MVMGLRNFSSIINEVRDGFCSGFIVEGVADVESIHRGA